ncbi:MAG: MFS transporter [Spirochaetales bacterium]|nr:MFS transporter [Spirochaetales bacterium]
MNQSKSPGNKLSRNIKTNYLFLGITYINLTQGLWMIWLTIRGYSLVELGILEGLFHLTSFLMEVPTGLVADLWGRKTSRTWGRVMFFLSLIILYYGPNLLVQALGFMLCAIGYNLESGAGEALLYDSLKELKREDEYKKIAGRNNVLFEGGSIVSFLVGGWCAHHLGYEWVFLPAFALSLLSLLSSRFFEEPSLGREERKRLRDMGWLKALGEQTRESVKVVREKPRIAFLILFAELIAMFITSLYFYLQTFWKGGGKDEFTIGLFLAGASLVSAGAGLKAEWLEKKLGPERVFRIFPLILIVCLWGIATTPWAPVFYYLTGFVDGMIYVAVQDYLNRLIPSERRATILSFQSMAFSLYMVIFFPLMGAVGDRWGLKTAFLGCAAIASVIYVVYRLSPASKMSGSFGEEVGTKD